MVPLLFVYLALLILHSEPGRFYPFLPVLQHLVLHQSLVPNRPSLPASLTIKAHCPVSQLMLLSSFHVKHEMVTRYYSLCPFSVSHSLVHSSFSLTIVIKYCLLHDSSHSCCIYVSLSTHRMCIWSSMYLSFSPTRLTISS